MAGHVLTVEDDGSKIGEAIRKLEARRLSLEHDWAEDVIPELDALAEHLATFLKKHGSKILPTASNEMIRTFDSELGGASIRTNKVLMELIKVVREGREIEGDSAAAGVSGAKKG